MKRRIFTILLVATLAVSSLAGCGENKDAAKTTENTTEKVETTEEVEQTLNADGIEVTGFVGKAANVELKTLTDGDDYKSATDYLATLTDKNITASAVYDIHLSDKDKSEVQPKDKVKINLTLSDDLANAEGDGYEVYRKEDDNTFTKLTANVKEKEISFDTEHFSIYVVVKTSSTPVEAAEEPASEATEQSPYSYTDMSATMYAQKTVNVRDLPDTNGNKVGGLSANDEVTVTGQCNETGWYRINYNGGTAYVSNDLLGDNKVEVQQAVQSSNTQSSDNTSASQSTDSQPAAAGNDNGGSNNAGNTASEELPSNPYPLDTLVEDTGSSISYYYLTEPGHNGVNFEMEHQAQNYIINMGKAPMHNGAYSTYCGTYKEGSVWKVTWNYQ